MKKLIIGLVIIMICFVGISSGNLGYFSSSGVSNESVFSSGTWQTEIEAGIIIKPETLNLSSPGELTAFITLPEDYDLAEIDLATVECQGAFAVDGNVSAKKFIAKFDRQDLVGVLTGEDIVFTVKGNLFDGTFFSGSDAIRVID